MKTLVLLCHMSVCTGYGQLGIHIARGFIKSGWKVKIRPAAVWEPEGWGNTKIPQDIRELFVTGPQSEPDELLLHPPNFLPTPGKRTTYFTMHETNRLTPLAVSVLNKADRVIVPCKMNAESFANSGVSRPIHIVPLGIDPEVFHYHPMPYEYPNIIRFGCAGRMAHGGVRKGINEVVDAFLKAFPNEKDVRLEVKGFPDCGINPVSDPRVIIHQAYWTDEQLAFWFSTLTCFVSAAKGEGWGLCLDPKTTVILNGRPSDIENAKPGDCVIGSDGKNRTVVASSRRKASNRFKIKCQGVRPIIATGEHPFLVIRTGTKNSLDSFRKRQCMDAEWVCVDELNVGNLVAIPRLHLVEPLPRNLDLFDFLKSHIAIKHSSDLVWMKMGFSPKNGCLVRMNRHIDVNDDLLTFIGWYLAEGSPHAGRGIEINLHEKEMPVAKWILKFIRETFGISGIIAKKPYSKCLRVQVCSTILSALMTKLCGKGAKKKELHPILYRSGKHLGPLLRGYVLGDGHHNKSGGWEVVSASRTLIWQIKNILNSVGINAPMFDHVAGTRLDMRGEAGRLFIEWTAISAARTLKRKPMRMSVQKDGYYFVRISKIEPIVGSGDVVNLEVDGDHTFLANGVVVHNCQHQSLATGRPLISIYWGGVAEFFDPPRMGYELCSKLEPAKFAYEGQGMWCVPDEHDLIESMKAMRLSWVTSPFNIQQISHDASQFTWENTCQRLMEVIK